MSENVEDEKLTFIDKILNNKGIIFIILGFALRIFMLLFYYYTHAIDPTKSWGDVRINYNMSEYYPPLTMMIIGFFKFLSFGFIEIFAFWAFSLDIIVMLIFYYVIKGFNLQNKQYIYGLFLVNPFLFLNNVFSLANCGYHITDSFFFIFLFMALYFFPKEKIINRYLFYIFLALSLSAKIFTLPILGFFFLKYLIEKDWKEMKIFLISTLLIAFIFLIAPIFYWENYLELYAFWNLRGEYEVNILLRLAPVAILSVFYIIFRLKKAGIIEITFFSILLMAILLFFSNPYIRYFQALLIYGILTTRVFFEFKLNLGITKRKIIFDNNLLVFYGSFVLVGIAYLIIIFIL